jgi:hypothetical protein
MHIPRAGRFQGDAGIQQRYQENNARTCAKNDLTSAADTSDAARSSGPVHAGESTGQPSPEINNAQRFGFTLCFNTRFKC